MPSSSSFHPKNSSAVKDDTFAEFIRAPITGDLIDVPGIGPGAVNKLKEGEEPVTTTYQLVGKYLSFKGEGIDVKEHCDRFWSWLQAKGINSFRAAIVMAIAQKCDIMFPGTFDPSIWEEEEP